MIVHFEGGSRPRRFLLPLITVLAATAIIGGSAGAPPGASAGVEESSHRCSGNDAADRWVDPEQDQLLRFLGSDPDEVRRVLGEPDDSGSSGLYGPHDYMLYELEGSVRLCSPELSGSRTITSIVAGTGARFLGTEVGMTFPEIRRVLGEPDRGPEPGMDGLHHMEYHFSFRDGSRPIYLNYSASRAEGPTNQAFMGLKAIPWD